MNDYFKYINSQGEQINFGGLGLVINENDLRDYAWSFNKNYNKITGFTKGITKKKITAKAYGPNIVAIKNALHEKIDVDVLLNKKGTIYIGDYYIKGFIYASSKKDYTVNGLTVFTLSFVTDDNSWKKETYFNYRKDGSTSPSDRGINYPYDYPYDYTSSINVGYITNSSFVPSEFKVIIYGPAENPNIIIGPNSYKVNISLVANEYLTIDSLNKTVTKTDSRGVVTNVFKYRDLNEGYIFEKVPTGDIYTVITPEANFDIVLIEERSEPKWLT